MAAAQTTASWLPQTFRKIVCQKLTSNFSEAASIVNAPRPKLEPMDVLIKTKYVGINASDINMTAGRYFGGGQVPFDIGFELIGEVIGFGQGVSHFRHGQPVALMENGAFAEYKVANAANVIPLPDVKAEYLALIVSGLTAAISLDKVAELKASDSVLVTAAAGGTGQFAVQWAKLKGCKTILGTASAPEKLDFLKSIGATRAINYKTEDLNAVLKQELPNGIDVVYESVGGTTFDTALANLAKFGRLMTIGTIVNYEDGSFAKQQTSALSSRLIFKSASVRGFMLFHFSKFYLEYLTKLVGLYEQGALKVEIDNGATTGKPFKGLDDVTRAVEYLYSGKNMGKIIVDLSSDVEADDEKSSL